MSLPVFKALKRLAMGDSVFPQQVTVGMRHPQCEITAWLLLGEIRLASIPDVVFRHASAEGSIAGVPIAPGERAILRLAAANRDPVMFSDPDLFAPLRRAPAHLSLGFGLHACAGGALIRMAMAAVTSVFLARFGWLTLRGRLEWEGGSGFRTPRRLLVG